MHKEIDDVLHFLEGLRDRYNKHKHVFFQQTEKFRSNMLNRIVYERNKHLDTIFSDRLDTLFPKDFNHILIKEIKEYSLKCDWNYIDPIILISCLEQSNEALIDRIARIGLLYHSFRILDDVLDDHENYKGNYPTLYGKLKNIYPFSRCILAASVLSTILLVCEGLRGSEDIYVDLAEKTVLGALAEVAEYENISLDIYGRIVENKMVCYGLILYTPILDAIEHPKRSKLESFLRHSFFLSQVVNDLLDMEEDRMRKQPNFWNLQKDWKSSYDIFVKLFTELLKECDDIAVEFQPYARIRLSDLANYAVQNIRIRFFEKSI